MPPVSASDGVFDERLENRIPPELPPEETAVEIVHLRNVCFLHTRNAHKTSSVKYLTRYA